MRILLLGFIYCFLAPSTTKIYIVRHAEKNGTTSNADLKTPEGYARANVLKDSLNKLSLTSIFSTNTSRTIHTAEPTANSKHLPVTIYNDADSLVDQLLLKKNKTFLIVGHSNTIPNMIRHLGLDPGFEGNIPDNDFDNLFVIIKKWNLDGTSEVIVRKTYGEPTP